MTREEAKVADGVYVEGVARFDGERFQVVSFNEVGCFLEDAEGCEFFAFWEEITVGRKV